MELLADRAVYALSDECYLRFVYPPAEVFSAASLPAKLRARLCIAGSFSKTYAMTGWRLGYALAPAEWTKAMLKVQSHSTSNPTSIAQWAATEALRGPQESVAAMLAEYTRRRAWLLKALQEIPGITLQRARGRFLCLSRFARLFARRAQDFRRICAAVVGRRANRGHGWRGFWRRRLRADFLRHVDGAVGRRFEAD